MRFRVLPEADDELLEAADWYERERPHLSARFMPAVRTALDRVRQDPRSLPVAERYGGEYDVRRCSVARYPYDVIFKCDDEEILVVAISHASRDPLYWLDRLE